MLELIKDVPAPVWVMIGTLAGVIFTYKGTRLTSKVDLDKQYLDKMDSLYFMSEEKLKEFKAENDEMKQKFEALTLEVNRLRDEMQAKDKLIERLENDNRKLEIDKGTYKRLLSEANDELNKLKGYG